MKKYFLSLLLIFILIPGFSQNSVKKPSRQKTQEWLISKINKYIETEDYSSSEFSNLTTSQHITNIKLRFEGDNIVIAYDTEEITINRYINDVPYSKTTNFSSEVIIPLNKLSQKVFIQNGMLFFKSSFNSFTVKVNNKEVNRRSFYSVNIKQNEEENFVERFNKAMNHLLTFIKKTSSSETF